GRATAPRHARSRRSRARGVFASGYVAAARLEGLGGMRIFWRHVLPNTLWPLLAVATLGLGQAIVWVSALGFLGLGALPPSPGWGALLSGGRLYLTSAWRLTGAPGLAITATAAATTSLGRQLTEVRPG